IGGGRVYWFATRNAPEGQKDGPAGTSTGPKATLTELFDGWHCPVAELISETDERTIRRDDLYDREPLSTPWGEGRVTLLGDAAHPMTPNLGQGACQAIEDAVVLARCLQEDGKADMPSALRRYEDARGERTAWILRRSRLLGRVGQIQDPLLCRLRDAILKVTPVEAQLRLFERVMDHEERPASRRSVRWFA
ncbi:MAG TPA: FAD-dependent monooxygenase, partial [Rubrobacteraceae bacterium]|nr:FAD-dependent monooxygenase [Rubrobacteraceae bacterium]